MGFNEIVNSTFSVYQQFSTWRQFKKDIKAVLRLLYLESIRNLSLIDSLDFNNKKIKADDESFKKIALLIETDILNLVFLDGKKNTRLFNIIEDIKKDELENEDDGNPDNNRDTLNALAFVYVKIWTIKKLASLDSKGNALKSIRYRARLKNISSAYKTVLKSIRELDVIKPLLNRNSLKQ
jgi:hypothetical protein